MKLLSVLCLIFCQTVLGQTNQWTQCNGPFGGFVSCLLVDSSADLFAGTDGNGILFSSDEGSSWHQRSTGLSSLFITDLTLLANEILFAATEDGVFKTTDHGDTWTRVDSWQTWTFINKIWIAHNGTILVGSTHGIYRSTNEGASWTYADSGLTNLGIHAFAQNAGCLFVGTEAGYQTGGGVHRSTDDGISWTLVSQQLSVWSLSTLSDGSVYAGTSSGKIYRSADSGAHWTERDSGLPSTYISSLFSDGDTRLYAGTGQVIASSGGGIFASTDAGQTWYPHNNGLSNLYVQYIAKLRQGVMAIGTGGNGTFFSFDSGMTWAERTSGFIGTTVFSLAVGPDGRVFAGTGNYVSGPYNGSGLFESTDNGQNWGSCSSGLTSSWIRGISFDSSGRIFVGTANGVWISNDFGEHWIQNALNFDRINAITVNMSQTILAASYHGIYRSTDAGASWLGADSGLTDYSVNCLVSNPLNSDLYAGTGNLSGAITGKVYRSTDNGQTWGDVSNGLPNTHIYALAMDSSGTLYAGGYTMGVFKSNNSGGTWQSIGLPGLCVVAIGINAKNHIFVSGYDNSGYSVFRTTNQGMTWSNFGPDLQGSGVYAFAFDRSGYLLVGSFRNGVFRTSQSTTDVSKTNRSPLLDFSVSQNYPNPFNPSTKIDFKLPSRNWVVLRVFDLLGRQVAELFEGELSSGSHTVEWNGSSFPSGVYFLRLRADDFVAVRRLVLMK